MNCWICSTRGCPRNKNSPVDAGLFRTCANHPRDGRAISAARFPHIGCHTLPPPLVICETPRHAPPFPSYRCHFAHLRACFPRLSTHPQTAPLMLHYQRFSTLINPPQLSCHGSKVHRGAIHPSCTKIGSQRVKSASICLRHTVVIGGVNITRFNKLCL